MNRFVIDASVAIKWVVAEPGTEEALALLAHTVLAPALWRAECANILWKKQKRGELRGEEAAISARLLDQAGVELCSPEPELARVFRLALALDHPAYDCVYLAAARASRAPLVTADERLIRVFESARRTATDRGVILDEIAVFPLVNLPIVN